MAQTEHLQQDIAGQMEIIERVFQEFRERLEIAYAKGQDVNYTMSAGTICNLDGSGWQQVKYDGSAKLTITIGPSKEGN